MLTSNASDPVYADEPRRFHTMKPRHVGRDFDGIDQPVGSPTCGTQRWAASKRKQNGERIMKSKAARLVMVLALATAVAAPLFGQSHSNQRRNNGINYHNGQVMLGTSHVYFVFYGSFVGGTSEEALVNFIVGLVGSSYTNINTTYSDATGTRVTNTLMYGRLAYDSYSQGTNLSDEDVQAIVSDNITNGQFPLDPAGIYIVIASDDVNADGLCTDRCEFHDSFFYPAGVTVRYAFVGDPIRCPGKCASQFFDRRGNMILLPPNGDFSIDARISWIAHVINGAITNPNGDGWFDSRGRENSDKCVNKFGPLYRTSTGWANVTLNGRDYLIQQNWVNADGGYCALAYP